MDRNYLLKNDRKKLRKEGGTEREGGIQREREKGFGVIVISYKCEDVSSASRTPIKKPGAGLPVCNLNTGKEMGGSGGRHLKNDNQV